MQTRYHNAYLTDGCWSPQRPGLFFLTRMDGFLDVWDIFYRQNEVAYSQKVSDAVLTSISINSKMAAIGDSDGTVHMMSLCKTLAESNQQSKEKEIMQQIFEREFRREKNLEAAKKQAELHKKPAKEKVNTEKIAARLEKQLKEIEENFFNHIAEDDDQLDKIKARGGGIGDEEAEGEAEQ